jgi:ribosomal protein L13E
MAYDVGSVVASLGATFRPKEFNDFNRELTQAERRAAKPVEAELTANVDKSGFQDYDREIQGARIKAARPVSVKLTADTDHRAFLQGERSLESLAKGIKGLLKQAAYITVGGIGAQAISALGAAGAGAATALAPLGGALAAYPALGSAFVQATGVMKLATGGVTDAVGGLNDQLDENSKAFKRLTPEAQEFARKLEQMKAPIRDLSTVAQRGLLPGLTAGAEAAMRNLDVLQGGIGRTARVIGDLATQAGKLVGSRSFGQDLDTQMRRNDATIRRVGEGSLNLADALRHVTLAAGPLVDWMTRAGLRFTELIDRQAKAGRESGQLAAFFRETRHVMTDVANIGGDLAKALFNIGRIGYNSIGRQLLDSLTRSADKFREWTESARGQNSILEYFVRARPAIYEVSRLIRDAVQAFFRLGTGDQVAPLLHTIRVQLLPAFEQLIDATTRSFGPAFIDMVTQGLLLFSKLGGSSGPLVIFVKTLDNALTLLNNLIDRFPILGSAIVTLAAIGGITKALGIVSALTGMRTLIGLLRTARGVAASTALVEGGAAAAGGAATGAAGGGLLAGLMARLGLRGGAAGGAGILARVGSRAVPVVGTGLLVDQLLGGPVETALGSLFRGANKTKDAVDSLARSLSSEAMRTGNINLRNLGNSFKDAAAQGDSQRMRSIAGTVRGISNRVNEVDAGPIRRMAREMENLAEARSWQQVQGEARRSARTFQDFEKTGSNSVEGIRSAVSVNFARIKTDMGTQSEAGKRALANNFRQAQAAVRSAMASGVISTRNGMRAIRGYMVDELKLYGMDISQARALVRNRTTPGREDVNQFGQNEGGGGNQRGGIIKRFMSGGWLVGKGLVGPDSIPVGPDAIAAPGEYVADGPRGLRGIFTRHQQREMAPFLAQGGYTWDTLPRDNRALPLLEALTSQIGGLSAVFSAIRTPHMFARGGVTGDTDYGPAMARALNALARAAGVAIYVSSGGRTLSEQAALVRSKGLYSASNPTGAAAPSANAPHVRGIAADITPGRSVLGALAGRFGLGFPLPSEPWHIQLASGNAGGVAARPVPRVNITGAGVVGQIANRAVQLTRGAAQRVLNAASFSGTGGDGPGGGLTSAGGSYNKAALARLWVQAGGPPGMANLMAAIALAESGGNAGIVNSIGATGLWQIHPGGSQYLNPLTNARTAVSKFHSQGLGAWEAYTNGSYRQFLARGGLLKRFAGGGYTFGPSGHTDADVGGGLLTGQTGIKMANRILKRGKSNMREWDQITAYIETSRDDYSRWDRRYDLSDETLFDPNTGEVDIKAVDHRLTELLTLVNIRQRVLERLRAARKVAARVVRTYERIVSTLTGSLKYARRKDRRGIRRKITEYRGELATWRERFGDAAGDIFDARTDLMEDRGELNEVAGIRRTGLAGGLINPPPADDVTGLEDLPNIGGVDTTDTAGGFDTPAPDVPEAPTAPTAEQVAAAAAEQLRSFQTNLQGLFSGMGSNFTVNGASGPNNPYQTPAYYGATPSQETFTTLGSSAGASTLRERAAVQITNNYLTQPDDPHLWSQRMAREASNAF